MEYGDNISRQAAINYFVTNVGFHDEDGYPIEDEEELREIWTGYFDGIPPAESEKRTEECTETHGVCLDTISRQAAINALDEQIALCDKALKSFGISMKDEYAVKVERSSLVAFREKLEYLQPAQPEPCEDAVSRKSAIDGLNDTVHEHNITDFDAVATILALPSVTPKQRTGKWILGDMCSVKGYWATCSVCGHTSFGGGNFCRECGAKMGGVGNDTHRRTD